MVSLADEKTKQYSFTSEDFEQYLKDQRSSTTFNGIEVEEFAWYKKLLGLKS